MKAFAFLAIVLVVIVGLGYQCSAGTLPGGKPIPGVPGTLNNNNNNNNNGGGGSSNTQSWFYVLVEMRGDDVTCSMYTTTDDLKREQDAVAKQNIEIAKADKALDAEIKKLKAQLATKTRELAKADGDDAKAAVQKEIDDLNGQIADKQGQIKPIVKLFPPRQFNKIEDAQQFMDNTQKEDEEIKKKKQEKADKKGK